MRHLITSGACALALFAAGVPTVHADEVGDQLKKLVAQVAPSVVTIKIVYKWGSAGGEQRFQMQGAIIDPSGLILVNESLFGARSRVRVTSMKVILENEEKEYEAFLVANDSKLHVAFVQMEELSDRKLVAVNLKNSAKVGIGDRFASLTRLGKGYDYSPLFQTGRICGRVKKPRKSWNYEGQATPGLPVFTLDGKVIGVPSMVESGLQERRRPDFFILPSRTIRASVQQALKKAVELITKRAEEKAKEAAGDKTDGDAKKDDAGDKKDGDAKKDDGDDKKDKDDKKDSGQ